MYRILNISEPNEELMSAKLGDLPMQIEQTAARAGTWFSTTKAVHSKAKVDIEVEAKHGRVSSFHNVSLTTCQMMANFA